MSTTRDYFSDDEFNARLKHKTVRGGLYMAAGQVGAALIAFLSVPVMARLLEPADFGLVAMVTVFTGFAGMFVDAGLSMATIQRERITRQQVSNLFWVAAGLGLTIAVAVSILSPAIAWFYQEPRLTAITIALSASFVLSGMTIQHQALLRRAMRFQVIALVQVSSHALAYLAAIVIAWNYRTYWALVVLPVLGALLRMLGTWLVCGWQPSLPRREAGMRGLIGFGANLTGFTFVNYFARNADNMLIGWWWGAVPLGFYERAYKLSMFPLQQFAGPLHNVTVPVLSRTLNDPARYRRAYLTMLESMLLVTIPLMAFVYVTRDLCIEVLLGPQFKESVSIFAWLGIGACFQPFMSTFGWLLISQARTRELFQWGVFSSSVSVISFLVGLPWGPVTVAACYVAASGLILMPALVYWTTRSGPVRARDLPPSVALPAGLGSIVFASLSLLRRWWTSDNSLANLSVCLIVAVAMCATVMLVTSAGQRRLAYYRNSLAGK